MSPEQARRERSDERSDVYCLAATMFHALTLRHPTWSENPDEFWDKKRRGVIDPLRDEDRRRVPRPLMAIVMKGLETRPEQRYASVAAFADELKRWQAGLAVSVYRETLAERFQRWYRRNTRLFWVSAASAAAIAAVGVLLLREKVQELVTWRKFYADDFSQYRATADLARNWQAFVSYNWWTVQPQALGDSAAWQLDKGALEGKFGNGFANLAFARLVPGDIRVEWTATPLTKNQNLNCFLMGPTRRDGYTFHVAGFSGGPGRCYVSRLSTFTPVDSGLFARPIAIGKPCRLRMEKEGRHVRFYKDGRRVIDYDDMDEISGPGHQTFGFEVCGTNSYRIDDVAVYYHPLPRRVSPLAGGDRSYARGRIADALEHYREVAVMYPGDNLAAVAMYRMGLCYLQTDSAAAALRSFESLEQQFPGHALVPLAMYERSKLAEARGDSAAALALLMRLGREYPGHRVLVSVMNDLTDRRSRVIRDTILAGYLTDLDSSRIRWLLDQARETTAWCDSFGLPCQGNAVVGAVADYLVTSEAAGFDDMRRLFPSLRGHQTGLLITMGQLQRVLDEYRDQPGACARALVELGRWDDVLRVQPESRGYSAQALLEMGRPGEVIERYPDQAIELTRALWSTGRIEEALRRFPEYCPELFSRLGRSEEYRRAIRRDAIDMASSLIEFGRPGSALVVLKPVEGSREFEYYLRVLEARRELGQFRQAAEAFAHDNEMAGPNAEAWRRGGLFGDALRVTARRPILRGIVFCDMGLYDSARSAMERSAELRNRLLWQSGAADDLLQANKGNRKTTAAALLLMGRFRDVVREYQDQRPQAARARRSASPGQG